LIRKIEKINRLDHIYRKTNHSYLIGNGTSNGLANPPDRIGTKLVAPGHIKFLDSTDEANVPLLNQIQYVHTETTILFCNVDNEPQVGLDESTSSLLSGRNNVMIGMGSCLETLELPTLYALYQVEFLLSRKQGNTTNLPQIHLHEIDLPILSISNHEI
jgi:hypothetical protein